MTIRNPAVQTVAAPALAPASQRSQAQFSGPRAIWLVLGAAWLWLAASAPAHAQFFSGPAYFSQSPQSQIAAGPGVDQLLITNNLTDFTVTGQYTVPIAPGPASGVVARWAVERRLNPNLNLGFQALTLLIGYSAPPPGSFNPSGGWVDTYVENTATATVVPGSYFSIPFSLQNGAATWVTASVSPTFSLVTGNQLHVMRQAFVLFGDYANGPGGNWVVDVPITTTLTAVPEAPIWLMFASAGALGWLRWRRASAAA